MANTTLTTLQITYDDKVDVNSQSSYQTNQLWTAEDANQVKNVVNQISTFYDLNLTSDGWKFNFVSTTDRASSISADTNTLQYVSSNSADSNKNINYSGNVLFYASVSAISQMVPNSSGSYDPQPFIATNPEHIATKAYVDAEVSGLIKTFNSTVSQVSYTYNFSDQYKTKLFQITIANPLPSRNVLWLVFNYSQTDNLGRRYTTTQINTDQHLTFIATNDEESIAVGSIVIIYYI